jgi:hypothetical protein
MEILQLFNNCIESYQPFTNSFGEILIRSMKWHNIQWIADFVCGGKMSIIMVKK